MNLEWQGIKFEAEKVPDILSRILTLVDDPTTELKIQQALRESRGEKEEDIYKV